MKRESLQLSYVRIRVTAAIPCKDKRVIAAISCKNRRVTVVSGVIKGGLL
jgi:hypothetical protein